MSDIDRIVVPTVPQQTQEFLQITPEFAAANPEMVSRSINAILRYFDYIHEIIENLQALQSQ